MQEIILPNLHFNQPATLESALGVSTSHAIRLQIGSQLKFGVIINCPVHHC